MLPLDFPPGRTARRLEWRFLPPHVRAFVEDHCGSPVSHAESQGSGFTPGFASVLVCEDGSRHFVKAASAKAQKPFADSYREEIRKLSALPREAAAAPLLWSCDTDWVVLGIEYVEGSNPDRPWDPDQLAVCLDALETVADVLTPAPDSLRLATLADEFRELPALWAAVRTARPDLAHAEDAARLAEGFPEVSGGDTVVHTDLRDDNVLIRPDGSAVFCDWNWPAIGAAWFDTLAMLIGPRGDGIDVEVVLRERRLTREVPPEHLDRALALLAGFFFKSAGDPVPPTSPYLRMAQRWQGEVVWDWLCERRGWV